MIRFKKKSKIFDIVITALAGMCSVGVMLYGVWHFGLEESYEELVLNVFYLACLVMMWMYFFNRLEAQRFNYWCSVCVGMTVLPVGVAALHAHFLLCAQELAELHQAQPVGYLRHRHGDCSTLQLRHLHHSYQRIYRLPVNRNLDTPHHHLRTGGLFRY